MKVGDKVYISKDIAKEFNEHEGAFIIERIDTCKHYDGDCVKMECSGKITGGEYQEECFARRRDGGYLYILKKGYQNKWRGGRR